MSETALPHLGSDKQLLFDDFLTDRKDGFATTMGAPLGREGPLIVPEGPWEDYFIDTKVSVVQREDRYQLWYAGMDDTFTSHLCYAQSTDGRRWEKPDCGLIEFRGGTANNIVYDGFNCVDPPSYVSGPVFLDPTAPDERRYKCVFPGPALMHPQNVHTLTGAYSPDGIHWTWCGKDQIVPWYNDTYNSAFWDPRIERYVVYARDNVGWTHRGAPYYRAVNRTESADFENFPVPECVLEAGVPDPQEGQLYNPGVLLYPYVANAYFAFPSPFYRQDLLDLRLYTSRDGIRFTQPCNAPFLTLGQAGCFDASMMMVGGGCLRRGDEVWLYYAGLPGGHTTILDDLVKLEHPRWGGVGLVRMRLDGFVSQRAENEEGVLTTRPFRFSGNRLQVNMNASAGGVLRIELLSDAGAPLPGYTRAEADPLYGNDVRKTVTWSGNPDVSRLSGQDVRLRFRGKAVDLYAFQFLPDDA